ncbi:MAG: DUF2252 domain-containing protein [Acidobacteriaceae bacterium]|nr:DUF2252 domain-containing protein [Acidobacteriaceae bacterium]
MATPASKRAAIAAANSRENRQSRIQLGRDRRARLSRSKFGELKKRGVHFDPIKLLLTSVEGRLPKLLPVKYSRMNASPFAFFRGAVSIMAADFARHPHTGLTVQLCGDAHLQNLGSFEGPDSRLVFDINDFDETTPGPWEWDVKRMAASIVLAGAESGHNRQGCSGSVEAFANAYCETLEQLANEPILAAARFQIHRIKKAAAISAALRQAARANPCDLLKKYAESSRDGIRFKEIPEQIWRVGPAERRLVLDSLALYRQSLAPERLHWFKFFRPLDVAFKIVGTGSVGLRDYVVLMQGNGSGDPLFLQVKQEVASAYAPYLKQPHYASNGQRVVDGQRRIQPLSDLLLGWTRIDEHDYLVRHLNDHKGSVDLDSLRGGGLESLAVVAGELLARGHARSGDALTIRGYIGSCGKALKAIVRFAVEYAELTEADFEAFQTAIKQERVKMAA